MEDRENKKIFVFAAILIALFFAGWIIVSFLFPKELESPFSVVKKIPFIAKPTKQPDQQLSSQTNGANGLFELVRKQAFAIDQVDLLLSGGYANPSVVELPEQNYLVYLTKVNLANPAKPRGIFVLDSRNGLSWNRKTDIILPEISSASAFLFDNGVRLYYAEKTGAQIISSLSPDGIDNWAADTTAISAREGFAVNNPAVFRLNNGIYRMIFDETKEATIGKIWESAIHGATSKDGVSWQKDSVPSITFDPSIEGADLNNIKIPQVSNPFVINWRNPLTNEAGYLLFYASYSRIFAAYSSTGFEWMKLGDTEINGSDVEALYLPDGSLRVYYGNPSPRGIGTAVFTGLLTIGGY